MSRDPMSCDAPIAGPDWLRCRCGQEYSRDEHSRCPACGSEPTFEMRIDDADDNLTVAGDWIISSAGSGVGMRLGSSGEGHRAHMQEVLHVKEKETEIRSTGVLPDPATVKDRETLLAFVTRLSAHFGTRRQRDVATFLDAAATHASLQIPPASPPQVWHEFAKFLLAGAKK